MSISKLSIFKLLRKLLFPFALVYGGLLTLRNWAFGIGLLKTHRVPVKVISVGNISMGGTGKTPMAEFLLVKLTAMGFQPAYLSRGYGRESKGFYWVRPGQGDGRLFGDEAFQVASKFPQVPVAVCEDRVAGLQQMIQEFKHINVVVLDDAFQHRRLYRDLDLVMVDANRLPWQDFTLPAGNLREPIWGLHRADMLLFSKFENPTTARGLLDHYGQGHKAMAFKMVQLEPQPFFEEAWPEDERILYIAFSGLGNNPFFFAQLKNRYPFVKAVFPFPDHYAYKKEDLRKIWKDLQTRKENSTNFEAAVVLTSEKDYFRLKGMSWMDEFRTMPLFYVAAEMQVLNDSHLLDELLDKKMNS